MIAIPDQNLIIINARLNKYVVCRRLFATSSPRSGLEEFFEDKSVLGEQKIRVGRSWKLDELRLKSNSDLHKLWYILLKERNMLLTMKHAYDDAFVALPNDERIDKVAESMENLEEVVKERNRAYYELECGVTGSVGPDTRQITGN